MKSKLQAFEFLKKKTMFSFFVFFVQAALVEGAAPVLDRWIFDRWICRPTLSLVDPCSCHSGWQAPRQLAAFFSRLSAVLLSLHVGTSIKARRARRAAAVLAHSSWL